MQALRVLAGIDFSSSADLALIEAHERAGPDGAMLVCTALGSPARPVDEAREDLAARVQQVTGRPRDLFSVAVDRGEPHAAIVTRAESWEADLVVVGSRGATGLSRVWLGSVAEKVARLAHCPVLIARPRSGSGVVLAGTDFSDPSLPAINAAYAEARRINGRVVLTHCLELPILLPDVAGTTGAELSSELLAEIETEAVRHLTSAMAGSPVPAEYHLSRERPTTALVRLAEHVNADLMVVGTRGRTGIARVLLGSVAEAVVRTAPCSVLVVRLHGQPAGDSRL